MSMIDNVTQMTIRPAGARVGGSLKFGSTPAGGVKAGTRLGSYDDKSNVDKSIFDLKKELECTQKFQYQKKSQNKFEKIKRGLVLASSGLKLLGSALSAVYGGSSENRY